MLVRQVDVFQFSYFNSNINKTKPIFKCRTADSAVNMLPILVSRRPQDLETGPQKIANSTIIIMVKNYGLLTMPLKKVSVHRGGETFWILLPFGVILRVAVNAIKCKWSLVHQHMPMCMHKCIETEILLSFPFLLKTTDALKNESFGHHNFNI